MRPQFTKKPKGEYLSYSRIWLYHNNPHEYYMRYVLGHKVKPTPRMEFGSIGHRALAEPGYNWRGALLRKKFMAKDEMVMERALREHPKYKKREIEFATKFEDVTLYGWIDAKNVGVIGETKFAAPGTWSQNAVDEDMQIGFYWFVTNLLGWHVKTAWLHACNTTNGKVTNYKTVRTLQDMEGVKNWIIYARDGIRKGVFS